MRGEPVIAWSSTGARGATGRAATTLDAWEQTVSAALEIARDAASAQPVLLSVGSDTARLYPAIDEYGRLDRQATDAAGQRLLAEIRGELRP
jgi:hypothetical protein